jgi:hypothetical protein
MARKKEEVGRPFTVRIRSGALADLEAWMAREGEAGLSHQKAILRLVAAGIHDVKNSPEVPDATKGPAAPGELSSDDLAALEAIEPETARKRLNERIKRLKIANRELRRQFAERTDTPAPPSPLDLLSPEGRAGFHKLRVTEPFAAMSDVEVLAEVSNRVLTNWAKKRSAEPAPDEPAPFVEPTEAAPASQPEKVEEPSAVIGAAADSTIEKFEDLPAIERVVDSPVVEAIAPTPEPEKTAEHPKSEDDPASPSFGWRREGRDLVSGGGATDALIAEIDAIKFDDPPEITEVVEEEVVEEIRN